MRTAPRLRQCTAGMPPTRTLPERIGSEQPPVFSHRASSPTGLGRPSIPAARASALSSVAIGALCRLASSTSTASKNDKPCFWAKTNAMFRSSPESVRMGKLRKASRRSVGASGIALHDATRREECCAPPSATAGEPGLHRIPGAATPVLLSKRLAHAAAKQRRPMH